MVTALVVTLFRIRNKHLEPDVLLNLFPPLTLATLYRYNLKNKLAYKGNEKHEENRDEIRKANYYIALAFVPYIIPELSQF